MRPLRVVLLGLGTVGRGVYDRLRSLPARFELVRAVVRHPDKHVADGVPPALLSTNPWDAINEDADVVIEAFGGETPATELLLAALLSGRRVVTANKAAIAAHWDRFEPYTRGSAPRLRFSAAAGGAVPLLEQITLARGERRVVAIRGVLNGTCNYVLEKLAAGTPYAEALADAQALGFAEPDPTADVSGLDAEHKLRLCAQAAFGRAPDEVTRSGIETPDARGPARLAQVKRQVASLDERDGRLVASVASEWLAEDDFLAGSRGEETRAEILLEDGSVLRLSGKGAGRLPTTASVLGDLGALSRATALQPPHETAIPALAASA